MMKMKFLRCLFFIIGALASSGPSYAQAQTTNVSPTDALIATNAMLAARYGVQEKQLIEFKGPPANDPRWKLWCTAISPLRPTFDSLGVYPDGKWQLLATQDPIDFCEHAPTFRGWGPVGVHPHVKAVQIVDAAPLVIGQVSITGIPTQTVIDVSEMSNCTSQSIDSAAVNLQVAIARATSVTVTKTITNAGTATIGGMIGVPMVFSANVSLSYTNTQATAHADLTGTTATITKSATETIAVPPMSTVAAQLSIYPIDYSVPVSTTVSVDGPLDAYPCFSTANTRVCPKKISDLIDPQNFRLPINFTVSSQDSSKAVYATYAVPYDPSACIMPGSTVQPKKLSKLPAGKLLSTKNL